MFLPLQTTKALRVGRGIVLHFFKTSALKMEGGWSAPRPGRFTPGKDTLPIVQEAAWATEPVWTGAENLAPHRDSIPGPSSPVASRYTVCAIPDASSW